MAKLEFERKISLLTSKLNIELWKKLVGVTFGALHCGSEIWTLIKKERKYLECFEIWCWSTIEKIKWSEKVTNEVLECIRKKRTP